MSTLLVTHPACATHDMGEGHPERPERMRAVDQAEHVDVGVPTDEREMRALLSRKLTLDGD